MGEQRRPDNSMSSKGPINHNVSTRRRLLTASILGIICAIVPVLLLIIDPLFYLIKFKLRIAEGSMVHDLLTHELQSIYISFYIYNVTNAEAFLSGEDDKLHLEEVGPFTFQEFRNNDNVTIDEEAGVMKYWTRMRADFIREKSIGYPEDIPISIPNAALLSATNIIGKYPAFLRDMYNVVVRQVKSKAIINVTAYEYLWGYKDPVMDIACKLFPGLLYYDKLGIVDRLYDQKAEFYMEIGAREDNKFLVKKVKKTRRIKVWGNDDVDETEETFTDAYEGAAYARYLSPTAPINIYRLGLCKLFGLQYNSTTSTEFGTAYTYTFANDTFHDKTLCNSKGFCPDGLIDISTCYYGCPYAISKSHLQNTDPELFERIQFVASDESKDINELFIEPVLGLTLDATLSIQLNLVLGNVKYNSQTRAFTDTVIPLSYITAKHPGLPPVAKQTLFWIYVVGPKLLLAAEVLLFLASFCLLSYSLKLMYHSWRSHNITIVYTPPPEQAMIKGE